MTKPLRPRSCYVLDQTMSSITNLLRNIQFPWLLPVMDQNISPPYPSTATAPTTQVTTNQIDSNLPIHLVLLLHQALY